jgi:hypothetical protein
MNTETLIDRLRKARFEYEKKKKEELEYVLEDVLKDVEAKMLDINQWDLDRMKFVYNLTSEQSLIFDADSYAADFLQMYDKFIEEYVRRLHLLAEKYKVKLLYPPVGSERVCYMCSFGVYESEDDDLT